ncbi:hypothetical protein CPC08DRAFT_650926 [Agrocybe pediades]|nr:hypothetical protein CPC08DRAFT_650926 [Agrocybe pediades]
MEKLWEDFEEETETNSSIAMRVATLSSKPTLARAEVIDHGPSTDDVSLRFRLEGELMSKVTSTVNELQVMVQSMASLIPERKTFFIVDPDDTLVRTLGGAESIGQLHAAWVAMTRRLEAAPRFMKKYRSEMSKDGWIGSPVSTAREIHEDIKKRDSLDGKLRLLHALVPRHSDDFSNQTLSKIACGEPWNEVIPAPEWLNFPAPTARTEISTPIPSRTSYKNGDSFSLPEVKSKTNKPTGSKAKKVSIKDDFSMNPYQVETKPYKSANAFFESNPEEVVTSTPAWRRRPPRNEEPAPPVPNMLWGLGAPSTGQQGSFGHAQEQKSLGANDNTFGRKVTPEREDSSEAENSTTANRQGPPSDHPSSSSSGSGRGKKGPPRKTPKKARRNRDDYSESDSEDDERSVNCFDTPKPAYGTFIPTIKAEFKPDDLPKWDGNHKTAINYFWQVQQIAALGGLLPDAMGFWLWKGLKENSSIQQWFAALTPLEQKEMRSHYTLFLKGIKDKYLGRRWQTAIVAEYEAHAYREPGHEHEKPVDFVTRRIMYTRMLSKGDAGGPLEVYLIMLKAPLSWHSVIAIDSIKTTGDLYSKITEHESALMQASRLEHGHVVTSDNLVATLKRLGVTMDRDASSKFQNRGNRSSLQSKTNLNTEVEGMEIDAGKEDEPLLAEAYQTVKRKQRPPPKGGYPFPKNDQVKTKLGRLPPSPCKVCGSDQHWDKECPDWHTYIEGRRRNVQFVAETPEDEEDAPYSTAYSILLGQRLASLKEQSATPQDFEEAVQGESYRQIFNTERKTDSSRLRRGFLNPLETITEDEEEPEEISSQPPEKETKRIPRRRTPRPGSSALGISVLSVKGYLCSSRNNPIDLRLDSCADISLISEEYYNSLKNKPKLQQGLRMRLWQVTDKDCSLKGYATFAVFMPTSDGNLIETEVEAYVLPGMTVPILLGEDYQQNYEVSVRRSIQNGTQVIFEDGTHVVKAEAVSRSKDFGRIRESAHLQSVFLRNKIHRRNKNRRQRRKVQLEKGAELVRIAEDVKIKPGEAKLVKLEGDFSEDREWLVERTFLPNTNDLNIPIPNALISALDPRIPIANTSNRPIYVRRGEVIGSKIDPQEYFDKSKDEESWERFRERSDKLAALVKAQDELTRSPQESPESKNEEESREEAKGPDSEETEEMGPKTAEMPELKDLPSQDLRTLIDVGNLPEHLKEKAWEMLERRKGAFGFDGRLGQHPAKVHIRTKEGQVPISVPITVEKPLERSSSHRLPQRQTSFLRRLQEIERSYHP